MDGGFLLLSTVWYIMLGVFSFSLFLFLLLCFLRVLRFRFFLSLDVSFGEILIPFLSRYFFLAGSLYVCGSSFLYINFFFLPFCLASRRDVCIVY
ncbi:hypothetical protein BZA05DRAFT_392064 [Tricharina praecox]|uniref:uncharacterized protein n=1 Tax=Tricharina praecox TaxID=43433 RepID=UPI00222100F1|nr:uncharacterized protein BZA05DRAFT_392064 [Tricharina praecox]KAI5854614.1 hypothetical protein BZA05DRAFT_392064 [Tricharina praecox]